MGPVKDPHLAEQHNSNPAPGPFAHFRSKLHKESFHIPQGRPPLTGRAKINSRVRWCLRLIKAWYH